MATRARGPAHLTVVDAITQRDLIRATADTDVALAGLYKALGGGWQGAADIPPAKRMRTGKGR